MATPGELRRRTPDAVLDVVLASGAAITWVFVAFQAKVEDQLGKLHAPGFRSFTYGDLHDSDVEAAFAGWRRGACHLVDFAPVDARTLILQRSAIATVVTIVASALLVGVLVRINRAHPGRLVLVAGFALASGAIVLVDLALGLPTSGPRTDYGWAFPWLDRAPPALLGVLALTIIRPAAQAARPAWVAYRAAPASSRLALGAAIGFFVVCNLGDIGAQIEDLLRRDVIADDDLHLGMVVVAVATYVGVLALLVQLQYTVVERPDVAADRPRPGMTTLRIGGVAAVYGVLVLLAGWQSAPLIGALLAVGIGGLSALVAARPRRSRRQQLGLRLALFLGTLGPALAVFGVAFGRDRNTALVGIGAAMLVAGLILAWRAGRETIGPDVPSGVEAAAGLVAAGFTVMALFHIHDGVVWVGLALAGLGLLLLGQARAGFKERWKPWLDPLGALAVVAGALIARAQPTGWQLATGAALGGVGLLVLLANRDGFVAVPAVKPAAEDIGPSPDGSPRGVLLAAAVLPAAGLLTSMVRALGGMLATGTGPPVALIIVGSGIIVVTVGGAGLIGTGSPEPVDPVPFPKRIVWLPLALLVAVPVVVASLVVSPTVSPLPDASSVRDAAMGIGGGLGPVALLVAALAGLAAGAGLVRIALRKNDQLPLFWYLGFHRTPVIGVVLTAFALVVVAGAPLERVEASSHEVRTIERQDAPSSAAPPGSVLDECESRLRDQPDAELRPLLCQWIDDVTTWRRYAQMDTHEALPLVFVTASGGGVRAASWTARVLDCLAFVREFGPDSATPAGDECPVGLNRADRWPYVFAIGGASGGSVGSATATAQALAPIPIDADGHGWAVQVGAPDHLGPVFGQMLLAETGLVGLGAVPEQDRAETLIDEWSSAFGRVENCASTYDPTMADLGFITAANLCHELMPLLLFNGTIVRSGGRFDISPLDHTEPDGSDPSLGLRDVLCGSGEASDIPLFDAAFLSARFPLVTPSGWLGYDAPCNPEVNTPVDVVDGGYHENSGAAQVAELWERLKPLLQAYNAPGTAGPPVRPILVQIVNGSISAEARARNEELGGTTLGCVRPNPDGEPPDETVETEPTEADERDQAIQIGEPARIPWAGAPRVLDTGGGDDGVADRLVGAFCRSGHPVVTFGLYDHPGRALPLGWSLTTEVLVDLQDVMAMGPNFCRAVVFAAFVDGATPSAPPHGCTPCRGVGARSPQASLCRDEHP